ncbi:high-affinity lysophosphatidic acid receptor-like [Asterias rubens]|uniref:high-affinity lysophosphatidic acid receptor-like n=1 Tax=Asterias rubens TaxID=7604 RepID=UPI0014551997|nr:high-affinity lysophosphatidic acid receptor-like [Asterias rubens]XP_033635499.1 high-affinity lysophosphatidic acid receptor-like [Asterias rubens]
MTFPMDATSTASSSDDPGGSSLIGSTCIIINQTSTSSEEPESTVSLPVSLPMSLGAIIPLTILMVCMIFISILGNSIVCLIVYQKPAMRSAINLLLANLAFADIMVSLFCMPFALITLLQGAWILGQVMCEITAFLYIFFVMEATFILATISVDRYFIIVRRKDKLNPHRAKIVIGVSWLSSFLVAFPPVVGWSHLGYSPGQAQCRVQMPINPADKAYIVCLYLAIFYIPCAAMSFSYLFILNTVRRNSLRVQNHPESLSISQANKLGLTTLPRPSRVNMDMSFKTRAFTTILLLFIVFIMCWAPSAIGMYVELFSESHRMNPFAEAVIVWLTYLNSAFNPIIYCWRIKKFREACRELAPKTFRLLPKLPGRTRRRIRPSAMYECNEQSSV